MSWMAAARSATFCKKYSAGKIIMSKKPCCDCPLTKELRDECILKNGEERKCRFLIQAHNMCMGYVKRDDLIRKIEEQLKISPRIPSKKICCSCPETKQVRDQCIMEHGQESDCMYVIEAHKMCLREEGFENVSIKNILYTLIKKRCCESRKMGKK